MNKTLTSFCIDAFDKSISSPIGRAIAFYYESLPFVPNKDINIFLLKQRLIDLNFYDSPESFITDLKHVVGLATRFFGTESDISIALLSFQYSIQKNLQPVIELKQNSSINSSSSLEVEGYNQKNFEKDSKWMKSKNKLLENLNDFLDKMPNDIESFKKFTEPLPDLPFVDNEEHSTYPEPDIKIDIQDLKSRIERIDQDKSLYELMDIIEHYQPELVSTVGIIRLDLKQLHRHTLFLIDEFVKKCKLRPLPAPIATSNEKIQRSQSLPLKKSNSSSTIILQNPLHNKSLQQQQELQQQVQSQQQQIQNQIQAQLQNPIQTQTQLQNSLQNQLQNSLQTQLSSQLQNQLSSQLQNQLQNSLQNQLPSQLQSQLQNQSFVQNQFQGQFPNNAPNYFTKNGINRKTALQSLNQQHQLQLQLKNINSYNIKSSRNNVSFSHSSSLTSPTTPTKSVSPSSLDLQDSNSSAPQSSLLNMAPSQSCLVPQKPSPSSQMMSNITVQPSSMSTLSAPSPSPPQQQQKQKRSYKPKQTKQTKQYKSQKNQNTNDNSNAQSGNIQLQLQMQMQLQQQNQQTINSESQQFSPFLQEAISIARMNNLIMLPDNGMIQSVSPQFPSSAPVSAPPTPAIPSDSGFSTTTVASTHMESDHQIPPAPPVLPPTSNIASQSVIVSPSSTSNLVTPASMPATQNPSTAAVLSNNTTNISPPNDVQNKEYELQVENKDQNPHLSDQISQDGSNPI